MSPLLNQFSFTISFLLFTFPFLCFPKPAFDGMLTVSTHVLFVDVDASIGGDGLTWLTAYNDLQDALEHADTSTSIEEIWVAEGTYYPTSGTNQSISFVMQNNLKILGGFTGVELDALDRDWINNTTILSGDIDQNGILDNLNSVNVIKNISNGLNNTAVLDGFTITSGYADEGGLTGGNGAGAKNEQVSPVFKNCFFKNNIAYGLGGAVHNEGGDPEFLNCRFYENEGVCGGGVSHYSSIGVFINCEFIQNIAFCGGALILYNSAPDITNCTFSENSGLLADALYLDGVLTTPQITNSILWETINGMIYIDYGALPSLTNCIVEGGYSGTNIWDIDPMFVDASTSNFDLQYDSPALNKGQNTTLPSDVNRDLLGNNRIISAIVDLGAREFTYNFPCQLYDSLIVVESPVFPSDYKAIDLVESASTVSIVGEEVRFISQNEVLLNPAFEVLLGTTFEATIEVPCVD